MGAAPLHSPGDDGERLLGIGEAAARAGVSERALRYYQQIGLIQPSGRTPGGLRRYSGADLDRVARIRQLQNLLGFDLEEVRAVLVTDDRAAELRRAYCQSGDDAHRRELIEHALAAKRDLRATVAGKLSNLNDFLAQVDAAIDRLERLKAGDGADAAPLRPAGRSRSREAAGRQGRRPDPPR